MATHEKDKYAADGIGEVKGQDGKAGSIGFIGDKTGRNDGVLCADNLCAGDFVEYRIRFTNGRVESVELIPERQWT